MTTTTVARIVLAPRERQILEGLADGNTLAAVALDLKIREGTGAGYLKLAKRKLHGVSENAAALAVGYATDAIARPDLLDPEGLVSGQDFPHLGRFERHVMGHPESTVFPMGMTELGLRALAIAKSHVLSLDLRVERSMDAPDGKEIVHRGRHQRDLRPLVRGPLEE
ncbi:hypothetical protein AB0I98_27490 [Streptomyces sp. NPDC050211]|uniref:hypothetical protein n=1 Tax=Streptomyces sp. NPDC050211 TaxID=3154932 RepID=UPI003449DC49